MNSAEAEATFERIHMAGPYLMLIGEDTRFKHQYATWEAEVAMEKGCNIIGVNLNMKFRSDSIRLMGRRGDSGASEAESCREREFESTK